MNFTGRLKDITKSISNKFIISFEINESPSSFDEITEKELSVEVVRQKRKRSLDANAYMWELLTKIANKLSETDKGITNWWVYLQALKKYGQSTYIVVKPSVVDKVKEQWRECEELGEIEINGQKGIQIQCFFGSSSYTSIEFSRLLGGIIEDAKDLGIDTITPKEKERLIQLYEANRKNIPS